MMSRRTAAAALIAVACGPVWPSQAMSQPRHGYAQFGDLKYPPEFNHFAYADPQAPKGGRLTTVSVWALNTFDSFNPFILKGDSPQEVALTFDSLMVRAGDEPDSVYGLVAESVDVAPDRLSATFRIRAEATFSDGTPITAADCVATFEALKTKGHPAYSQNQLRSVTGAVAVDTKTVRYTFEGTALRALPGIVGGLPILSAKQLSERKFEESGLEPWLGSGPYKIGDYRQGAFVTFVRRADYWGRDLPVNRGRWNFDELRFEFFKERTAAFEAVKAGLLDVREDFTSKDWATGYNIAAVAEKRLLRETLPDKNPSGTQGFWINTRKAKFQDVRVRQALDFAFDYQWTNKNLFYELYERTTSYFENSPMEATGKPSAAELKLLEPFRDKLPGAVFDEPYMPPVSDGSGNDRRLMRQGAKLLADAGFTQKGGQLVDAKGAPFEIEFLITDASSERLLAPFVDNLKRLGIVTSIRKVDPAQYERRRKSFDYDILTARFTMQLTPGPELGNTFSSRSAATEGSSNLAGVADPVVDHLLIQIAEAATRDDLMTAARALDRVLRASHYWVPHWFKASHHIAMWDKFGRPPLKPDYDRGILDTWWFDATKAARLKQN